MRIPESVELVTVIWSKDENGISQKTETKKTVYGYVDSVSANEFFEGGRNGLNPEFRFVMTELDYNDQTILIRNGQKYGIYRTYRPNNGTVELYAERKGGTNGGGN